MGQVDQQTFSAPTDDLSYGSKNETTFIEEKAQHDELEYTAEPPHLSSVWEEVPYKTTLRLFWKGALVCFLAGFSSFTDGYQIAVVGNIIGNRGFLNTMGTEISVTTGLKIIDSNVLSAWGAIGSVCQWLGMNIFPFLSDKIGRKWTMCTYWVVIAAGVMCESFANDWKVWTVAKICQGLGVGAMQFSLQVYIAEMSPTSKIRGMMMSCYNFWWTLGLFIGTIAITFESRRDPLNWRTIILTQWGQVGLMGVIYLFVLPETPWWYAKKNKAEQCIKLLNRLYGKIPGYNAETEYSVIKATVDAEEAWAKANAEISWRAIFKGVNGWRTMIAGWELAVGCMVGQSFLGSYTVYFFEIAGSTDPFANTCITSGLGIASTLVLVFGLDYIGRRRIINYCLSTQWTCLILIGGVGMVSNPSSGLNKFLIVLACIWSFCFYIAAGCGWTMVGEVPTARLRARTAGFAAGISVLVGIPIGYGTPYMISANDLNWGLKTCFFFAGLSFFPVLATWFVLPETTGRSPAELDEMFENKVRPWRFRKYVTDVQKARDADAAHDAGVQAVQA